jgi:peptidoglycan hydrolase-like protein with peptidoglycan-binding domain
MQTDIRAGRERNRRRLAPALAAVLALAGWAAASPALADYNDGITAYENRDYATAQRELQPLADRGDPRAQRLVGLMYRDGLGVRKDLIRSYMWFDLAAQRNQYGAADLRDELARQMQPWQVDEAKKMVAAWPQPQAQPQTFAGNSNPQFQSEDLPPAASYRGPMTKQQLADLQWQLAVHGYDPGASDGNVGPGTQDAIQQYQADAGLPVDGQPSTKLLEHLQYTDPPVLNRHTAQARREPAYGAPSNESDNAGNGPSNDNGSYDNGPSSDNGSYDNGPSSDNGPSYDNGLSNDNGPTYDNGGGYGQPEPDQSAPMVGAAPSLMQVYTATVQQELARRGYNPGRIDGVLGSQTQSAIRDFQEDNGLPVTGEVSLELVNYLRLVTTAAAPTQ